MPSDVEQKEPPKTPGPADPKNPFPQGKPCAACVDFPFCLRLGYCWWLAV
jgi:hypothetical protein